MRAPLVLAIALLLAACGGTSAWPKTAGETTCAEWTQEMTEAQRSVLGAAMLLAVRANHGGTIRPPDAVLNAYTQLIGDVCASAPDSKISAVGATIYGLSKDLQP